MSTECSARLLNCCLQTAPRKALVVERKLSDHEPSEHRCTGSDCRCWLVALQEDLMPGLVRNRTQFNRVPAPGGMTGEQASSVYQGFYGEMPMPATQFATSVTALASLDVTPSLPTRASNASVVDRTNDMTGYRATAGVQDYETTTPQMLPPVLSSKFQDLLIGPHVNYIQNLNLFAAGYPAATVMLGGMHNLALSTKVDQLVTRTTGGPGPGSMRQAPRFKSVQTVPRYSTMPSSYPTQGASS